MRNPIHQHLDGMALQPVAPPVPTRCTSMACSRTEGHPYCQQCSHAEFDGEAVAERRPGWPQAYRWTFCPQFGPTFYNSHGREVTQPSKSLWAAFEQWQYATFGGNKEVRA